MPAGERPRRRPSGFTYIGLLVAVALLGLLLSAAGEVARTAGQREREAQLLWVGHEYRTAIAGYWRVRRAYPKALQDLLGSAPDAPLQVRWLRRLYPDPMTNAVDWVLLPAPDGGIMGVASSSKRVPIKVAKFDEVDRDFIDAKTYGDWQFAFQASTIPRAAPRPSR